MGYTSLSDTYTYKVEGRVQRKSILTNTDLAALKHTLRKSQPSYTEEVVDLVEAINEVIHRRRQEGSEKTLSELFELPSEKVPDTLTSKGLADLDRLGRGGEIGPYSRALIRLAAAELYRYRLAESRAQRRRDLVKQIEERQEELRRLTTADMKEGK